MDNILIPERAARMLRDQQQQMNAMIVAISATLDVPDGWQITPDGRSFAPPMATNGAGSPIPAMIEKEAR